MPCLIAIPFTITPRPVIFAEFEPHIAIHSELLKVEVNILLWVLPLPPYPLTPAFCIQCPCSQCEGPAGLELLFKILPLEEPEYRVTLQTVKTAGIDLAPHCILEAGSPPTKCTGMRAPLSSCVPVVTVPNSRNPVLPAHVVLPHWLSNMFDVAFQSTASDTIYGGFFRNNSWNLSSPSVYVYVSAPHGVQNPVIV